MEPTYDYTRLIPNTLKTELPSQNVHHFDLLYLYPVSCEDKALN